MRRQSAPKVIAVTGAAVGPGRVLLERLAQRDDLDALIGIDTRQARVDGVVWRAVSSGAADLSQALTGVTALVDLALHVDLDREPALRYAEGVAAARRVLAAAAASGVGKVVLCTSGAVYGVGPHDRPHVLDSSSLAEDPSPYSLLAQHLAVEDLARAARTDGLRVTVLRPAQLVGLSAGYDGVLLRQLDGPRLLAIRGQDPQWQLCHVEDLAAAVECALFDAPEGCYGVASEGALPQRSVEALTGKPRSELPAAIALSTAHRLQRLGLASSDPAELDHVRGRRVLAADGLRAAGWLPQWGNARALEDHLSLRRKDSRSGAYTAAGATIALLGTAALVRQARRRRRR